MKLDDVSQQADPAGPTRRPASKDQAADKAGDDDSQRRVVRMR